MADNIILLAGGCGLSAWKVDRDYGVIEDLEYSGIREFSYRFTKLFNFKGYNEWLPRITLDPTRADCGCAIYGIVDRTILVYSLKEKSIVTKLFQAHDGVITRVVWYSRSQFYITACNQGFIKAWAWRPSEDNSKFLHASMASKSPSYVVRAHTKAVTGLDLHPVPGLLISSGLEGTLAVTNLETGQELFKLYLYHRTDIENIFNMKYMKTSKGPAVIFSTSTGYLKVWRIVSKTAYYDMAVTDILSISSQDAMRANISKYDPMYILPTGFASNNPLYVGCVSMFSGSALHIVPTILAYPQNINNLNLNENNEENNLNDEEKIKLKYERDLIISRGFKVPSEDIVDGALDYCMSLRSQRLFVLSDYGTKIKVYGVNDRSSVFWQHRKVKDSNALQNGKSLEKVSALDTTSYNIDNNKDNNNNDDDYDGNNNNDNNSDRKMMSLYSELNFKLNKRNDNKLLNADNSSSNNNHISNNNIVFPLPFLPNNRSTDKNKERIGTTSNGEQSEHDTITCFCIVDARPLIQGQHHSHAEGAGIIHHSYYEDDDDDDDDDNNNDNNSHSQSGHNYNHDQNVIKADKKKRNKLDKYLSQVSSAHAVDHLLFGTMHGKILYCEMGSGTIHDMHQKIHAVHQFNVESIENIEYRPKTPECGLVVLSIDNKKHNNKEFEKLTLQKINILSYPGLKSVYEISGLTRLSCYSTTTNKMKLNNKNVVNNDYYNDENEDEDEDDTDSYICNVLYLAVGSIDGSFRLFKLYTVKGEIHSENIINNKNNSNKDQEKDELNIGMHDHEEDNGSINTLQKNKDSYKESAIIKEISGPSPQCNGPITCISFCESHSILVVGSEDHTLNFYNLKKCHIKTIVLSQPVVSIAFVQFGLKNDNDHYKFESLHNINDCDLLVSQKRYVLNVKYKTWRDKAFNNTIDKINLMDYENEGYSEITYDGDNNNDNNKDDYDIQLQLQLNNTNDNINDSTNVIKPEKLEIKKSFITEMESQNPPSSSIPSKSQSKSKLHNETLPYAQLNVRKPASWSKPDLLSPTKFLSSISMKSNHTTTYQYFGKDIPPDPIFGKIKLEEEDSNLNSNLNVNINFDTDLDLQEEQKLEQKQKNEVLENVIQNRNNDDNKNEFLFDTFDAKVVINDNDNDILSQEKEDKDESDVVNVSVPVPPTSPIRSMSSPSHPHRNKMMTMTYPSKYSSPNRKKPGGIERLGSPKAMTILGLTTLDDTFDEE